MSKSHVKSLLADVLERLYAYREKRPPPVIDNKILTSWNGLMISSLAYASRSLKNKIYLVVEEKTADFICQNYGIKMKGRCTVIPEAMQRIPLKAIQEVLPKDSKEVLWKGTQRVLPGGQPLFRERYMIMPFLFLVFQTSIWPILR